MIASNLTWKFPARLLLKELLLKEKGRRAFGATVDPLLIFRLAHPLKQKQNLARSPGEDLEANAVS
jgi:hypothetical protein